MGYVAVDVETAQACNHVIEIALVEIVGGAMTGREHGAGSDPVPR